MKKTLTLLLLSLLPSLSFAGGEHSGEKQVTTGISGNAMDVSRTIDVEMSDSMRFSPSLIKVKAGETIRFSVKNSGKLHHELVLGDIEELKAHADMMQKMPNMQHQNLNLVSLEGGTTGFLIWKFDHTGNVNFACLIPGHSEAGMKGLIEVNNLDFDATDVSH